MPLTYFAHQLFVLPFKSLAPRQFDGTALCIGSMAPDFAYAFVDTPWFFHSHTLQAQVTWSVPVTYLLSRVTRRFLAEPLGAQLPDPLGCEVRALAHTSHPWWITVLSALLGGMSHIFVDSFTHRHGWGYDHFAVLHRVVAPGWQVADVLQYVGHSLGSLLAGLWMWRLCVTHRVSAWNGAAHEARSVSRPAPWFWPTLQLGAAACALAAALGVYAGMALPIAIIRASYLGLALLLGMAYSLRRATALAG